MQKSMANLIKLLDKHQYLVKSYIRGREIVLYLPENHMNSSYDSAVIKYKFFKNPSRIRITYQNLGDVSKKENIKMPSYAAVLFVCCHITNICVTHYNYDTSLIQYYVDDKVVNNFIFLGEYLKSFRLSPENVNKHTELTLLCGLAQQNGNSMDLLCKAEQLGILEGYHAIFGSPLSGKTPVESEPKSEVESKSKGGSEGEKSKFSFRSLFGGSGEKNKG